MKVYIVYVETGAAYQGTTVDGVYSNQEAAQLRAREIAYVEERDVVDEGPYS